MSSFIKNVIKVTQSPMNHHRWCLDLECGHDKWVTSKRRPTRKTTDCDKCLNQEMPKEAL